MRHGRSHDQKREPSVVEHGAEACGIAAHHEAQNALDHAVEPRRVGARRLAHEMRADHRRHRERHHGRNRDREGERHREFAEHAADQSGHEQQRDEGGDQRNADREHGEADLPRALDRRAERRHALLQIAEAVLDHDDGVVDHEPDRYRERHQREIVDREAGKPHHPRRCRQATAARSRRRRWWPPRAAGTRTPPA